MTEELARIFLDVRQSVDRSAFSRFKRSRNIATGDAQGAQLAFEEFRQLRPLDRDDLRALAREALTASASAWRDGSEPFPATLWTHGARHVKGGRAFTGTLRQFAALLLPERARTVNPPDDPKRGGWVIEPTTNPTGVRENDSTHAMHALFLDCDSTGEWDWLLYELSQLQLCYVAYQSGGWTTTSPKWRAVVPLALPFVVSTEEARAEWKIAYNHARVLFGALGRLSSVGFDPATETPCNPWFLTERRNASDPERRIIWQPGRALNLKLLANSLPTPHVDRSPDVEYALAARITLSEERFEEIVDALAASTSHVPSGRRTIYLSMPAVMLNRGVMPDDVRKICAEVSSRYPRVHKDKHEDNLHNVETTIAKWETDGPNARITQIATLQSEAPEVAAALDEVLPNLKDKAMLDAVEAELGGRNMTVAVASAAPTAQYLPGDPQPPPPPTKVKRKKRTPLEKKLQPIAKRLTEHRLADRRLEGKLMQLALKGSPLPGDEGASRLAAALGYHMPKTTWQEALELMGSSLLTTGIAQDATRVATLESAFATGRKKRDKSTRKIEAKKDTERQFRAAGAWEVR